jgi:hypothetical protein
LTNSVFQEFKKETEKSEAEHEYALAVDNCRNLNRNTAYLGAYEYGTEREQAWA